MRREQLCAPTLCHDRHEGEERCDRCPLTRLEWYQQHSYLGMLLQRANDKRRALSLGFTLTLDDIAMDEMRAMAMIEEERDLLDKETQGK
jgi:hypothetical protein